MDQISLSEMVDAHGTLEIYVQASSRRAAGHQPRTGLADLSAPAAALQLDSFAPGLNDVREPFLIGNLLLGERAEAQKHTPSVRFF